MARTVFLTAEWKYLLMLNYAVDPSAVSRYVPGGTEIDTYNGRTFVSVVGFLFQRTRIFGVPVPFHINFEEVNLRLYVRRKGPEGSRRGVVFVREMVPRRAIAFIARTFYGEPYVALPMRNAVSVSDGGINVEYGWRRNGWESISASASGRPEEIAGGSEEEFITEHYWGYTGVRAGCNEYEVEHPRWRTWRAETARLDAYIGALYGHSFVESLSAQPSSAFIADGSAVIVRYKTFIT